MPYLRLLMTNYHLRADPELVRDQRRPDRIAIRRFPCFCVGCVEKMREPIATRYEGACNTCQFWDVFKKSDGTETGYNDWKVVDIVPDKKKHVEEDELDRLEVAMNKIGERMGSQMKVGNIGAYIADDDDHDYYLFVCTTVPEMAEEDKIFKCGNNEFAVKKGELYCKGKWLDKIQTTTKWFYVTEGECVVRMQVVVDANVELTGLDEERQIHYGPTLSLPRNMMHNLYPKRTTPF